ncbi:MAG: tetratricopeptide repeat protein [Gammaproteobacteria bacterium]|nr:tetratricopeptide repeat protein [Gammaproteobacteria bacterium]
MTPAAALLVGVALAGGLWPFGGDEAAKERGASRETIRTLKSRDVQVNAEPPAVDSAAQAMDQYRRFLALKTGSADMRAEALRRLADLNLDAGVNAESAGETAGAGAAYFAEAISLYKELLELRRTAAVGAPADDAEVLYQLSRALEGAGQGDDSLRTLDTLVASHPAAKHQDEAEFRRGETYFVRQNFAAAEQAYAAVLAGGDSSPFYEQSLYKHGWALFKQGRNEEGLASFLELLERKLGPGMDGGGTRPAALVDGMSRPERELLDDTLRVTSITYSYLDGAASIPVSLQASMAGLPEPAWTYLLYNALGDLYLDKERFRDAAETYQAFVAHDPVNDEAPRLQQAAIEAYTKGKFPSLVLDAKRQYVETYGLDAPFWATRQQADYATVVASLKTHLTDLAAYDHSEAQKSRQPADYERAAGWYRRFLAYFPADPESAERSFLLGELLFESKNFAEARDAYLRSAYEYGPHEHAAEAGYAALLASREHEKQLTADALAAWHEQQIGYSLQFAATYPAHPQAGAVLTNVAEELFKAGQLDRAIQVAGLVVTLQPPASPDLERVAWTVLAHSQFDLGRFADAEGSYQRLRAYNLPPDQRKEVEGRVAASIYRQAESAQASGDVDAAVANFLRIAEATPDADIRPTALFDAATLLLTNQRWGQSVDLLQRFRRDFPEHRFNADVTTKLAVALKEDGRPAEAAGEYERIAATDAGGADVQRAALWQAAELYATAGQTASEARLYEAIVARFPNPPAEALEARYKLASLAAADADWTTRKRWLEAIVAADAAAGAARTDRSRFLAANAAIELARPKRDAFLAVSLSAPLKQSLKLKKNFMEQALQAYSAATQYGVAQVTTAATFETAELYYQLSRDLLASERPADLTKDEQEEYGLLLEEQAFPFEEKAIDLFRVNADRVTDGVYDEWVRASFARLSVMTPARYARTERSEDVAAWLD